jgi:outer membrane receptor protein involved in Fe transport
MKSRSSYAFILWVILSLELSAFATSDHQGFVSSGEVPVPGVVVRARSGDTEFRTITDLQGVYWFKGLTQGTWRIRLEMQGFAYLERDVVVGHSSSATNWVLQLLPLNQMDAEPSSPPTSTTKSSPFSEDSPPDHHGSGSNPGFTRDGSASRTTDQLPAEVLLVNGSINDRRLGPFGNNSRMGLASYTGSLDVAANNSALNARPFSLTGRSTPQPDYSSTDVLFSLSGPLRLPFRRQDGPTFTLVYGRGQNRNVSLQAARVPSLAERVGDFSDSPVVVVDPVMGSPFTNNAIPHDRVSPEATALLPLYPLPNSIISLGYNYQVPTRAVSHRDHFQFQTGGRIDAHRISTSVGFQSTRSDSPNLFAFVDRLDTSSVSISLSWSSPLTENLSASAQYAFSRTTAETTPHFANLVNVSGDAGIRGNSQDPRDWGPPQLNFAGGITGLFDGQYAFDRTLSHSISYGSTWSHNSHGLSFGGGFRREKINSLSQQNARGTFTFTGARTGIDFADFLLGIPTASSIAYGNADKYFRQSIYNAYLMDDWRITPQLTLNVGIRWDYEAPVTERYDRLVNLDITPGFEAVSPILPTEPRGALTAQSYPRSLIRPDRKGLQPRVGLAWRPLPDSSLVVRAGFGTYRETGVYRPIAAEMAQQSPLSTSLSVENGPETRLTLTDGFGVSPQTTPNTFAVNPNFRVGRTQNWQLSLQFDLSEGFQATASYVGVKGSNLPQRSLPNTFPSGTPDSCSTCPRGFVYLTSEGTSSQHAATIVLRRRLRGGLGANLQYTWSKAIDDAGLGGFHVAQDWQNLGGERGLSNFDRRHQVQVQTFYATGALIGLDESLAGWVGSLLREWTLTTDWKIGSGSPMTPTIVAPVPGTGVTGSVRPDRTDAPVHMAGPEALLNPDAFSLPAPGRWGNAGRNSITGPSQFSLDASIGRSFRIGEGMVMDFRLDVMNLLNHVTFPAWDTSVDSAQYGLPTGANPMRTVRPSLRVRF